MLSGSSVNSGYGFMVVTAVGMHSRWGKIKSKLSSESNDTPLQGNAPCPHLLQSLMLREHDATHWALMSDANGRGLENLVI